MKGQGDVFPHSSLGQDLEILKDDRNIPAQHMQPASRQGLQIISGNDRLPALKGESTVQEAKEGGFSSPGRAG